MQNENLYFTNYNRQFKHSFRQNAGLQLLGPSSIKISPCDSDKVLLRQLPAPGRTVLSTLPDNRGDSRFWTILPVSRLESDISQIIAKAVTFCRLDFPIIKFQIFCVVMFLDFHSTKQGLPLVDSWSCGLD